MSAQVLVLYYSRHGSVAALAEKIAIGVQQAGADIVVKTGKNDTDFFTGTVQQRRDFFQETIRGVNNKTLF